MGECTLSIVRVKIHLSFPERIRKYYTACVLKGSCKFEWLTIASELEHVLAELSEEESQRNKVKDAPHELKQTNDDFTSEQDSWDYGVMEGRKIIRTNKSITEYREERF